MGSYQWFLRHALVPSLSANDLLVALEWVRSREYHNTSVDVLNDVADAVILKAWEADAVRGPLLPLFADVVIARFAANGPLIKQDGLARAPTALAAGRPATSAAARRGGPTGRRVGTASRKPDLHKAAVVDAGRCAVAGPAIVGRIGDGRCRPMGGGHLGDDRMGLPGFRPAVRRNARPRRSSRRSAACTRPMALDDPRGAAYREQRRRFKADQKRYELPLLEPPPAVWLEQALQKSEAGKPDAWYDIYIAIMLQERQGDHWHERHDSDLRTTPGWQKRHAFGSGSRARIRQGGTYRRLT